MAVGGERMNTSEANRWQSNKQKLRAHFEAHPLQWLLAADLEAYGGRQAWRTRLSELRKTFEKENLGTIENHLTHNALGHVVASAYRYLLDPSRRRRREREAWTEIRTVHARERQDRSEAACDDVARLGILDLLTLPHDLRAAEGRTTTGDLRGL